jgi:autophagy-related protein 11
MISTILQTDNISATPPIRPAQLAAAYARAAQIHHDHITKVMATLHYQLEGFRIASSSLDLNVLAISDTFQTFASGAQKELDQQTALLAGLQSDLDIISRVNVHSEFLSPAVRRASEAGDKARTLGDYVSQTKMMAVAETCARTHGLFLFRLLKCV